MNLVGLMRPSLLRRAFAAAAFGLAGLTAVLPPGAVATATAPPVCGLTTLTGTIAEDRAHPGTLTCGPGRPMLVREDLAGAKDGRHALRDALTSFVAFADFQLADEESPLRAEFLDKCANHPTQAAFRWQETMIPQLINAHVRAANAIARGPVTGRDFDFAVQLGDASDNQQWNEVRWFVTLLDGSLDPERKVHLVNPDSGADSYEGVQGRDPATGDPALHTPADGSSIRDLANEPFYADGLRRPDGSRLPWYSVMGNHDMKTQGTMTNTDAWTAFAGAWVTGDLKVTDLAPDQQQRVCGDPSLLTNPAFWMEVAGNPTEASTKRIQADPARRQVSRTQWIAEHLPPAKAKQLDAQAAGSYGLPAGHGFQTPSGADNRCRDGGGNLLDRACYSFDLPGDPSLPTPIPLHFIALDTGADEGLEAGNLTPGEWDWLKRDLIAHSTNYFDDSGNPLRNDAGRPSLIAVFSHHTGDTTTNTATTEKRYTGADLEKLLLQFPNVVLHANGHTHYNKVWPHKSEANKTAYWEVNTSAIADWPHLSRTIEIADNHDGTLSIIGVNFDGAAPPNPRLVRWSADDPSSELARKSQIEDPKDRAAAERNINETWLASAAREVGFNDPQSGAETPYGENAAADGNVELLLANPFGTTQVKAGRKTIGDFPSFPGFPGVFPPPQLPPFPFPNFPDPNDNSRILPPAPFSRTLPGIGVPAKFEGPDLPIRATTVVLGAALLAAWLFRARVRGWMLGR